MFFDIKTLIFNLMKSRRVLQTYSIVANVTACNNLKNPSRERTIIGGGFISSLLPQLFILYEQYNGESTNAQALQQFIFVFL